MRPHGRPGQTSVRAGTYSAMLSQLFTVRDCPSMSAKLPCYSGDSSRRLYAVGQGLEPANDSAKPLPRLFVQSNESDRDS